MTDIIVTGILSGLSGMFGAAIGAAVTGFIIYLQANQKLKLDSIISVINGVQKFKLVMIKILNDEMYMQRETKVSSENGKSPSEEEVLKTVKVYSLKIYENSHLLNVEIGKLIFLLEKDESINEKNSLAISEMKKLEVLRIEMLEYLKLESLREGNIQEEFFELEKFITLNGDNKIEERINESIEKILKTYKERLNKESKFWFIKLLNCFCKSRKCCNNEKENHS